VQDAAARERQDRRAHRVLQRAGRPHRGQRTPGATKDQVLLSSVSDTRGGVSPSSRDGRQDVDAVWIRHSPSEKAIWGEWTGTAQDECNQTSEVEHVDFHAGRAEL